MIQNVEQLRVTMQQMDRLLRALEDLRENVLPQDPQLFATLAEATLDDLQRLRTDVDNFIHELQPAG